MLQLTGGLGGGGALTDLLNLRPAQCATCWAKTNPLNLHISSLKPQRVVLSLRGVSSTTVNPAWLDEGTEQTHSDGK